MTNPALDPGPGNGPAAGRGRSSPAAPRWVKVFGIVAGALALLVLILMMVGGGNHGPGRHFSSERPAGQQPPAGSAADTGHGLLGAHR
ncbi:MAG: hypothetical protein ACRDTX_06630 [Pseudonocardiaceae bacterium]